MSRYNVGIWVKKLTSIGKDKGGPSITAYNCKHIFPMFVLSDNPPGLDFPSYPNQQLNKILD